MTDLDIAMREIEETKDDIYALEISDVFQRELGRIRDDLALSAWVMPSDFIIKCVLLAHIRSTIGAKHDQA